MGDREVYVLADLAYCAPAESLSQWNATGATLGAARLDVFLNACTVADGRVLCGDDRADLGLHDTVDIALGAYHGCALDTAGTVRCWGQNDWGQLGIGVSGGRVDTPVPIRSQALYIDIDASHNRTCGVRDTGTIDCWGLRPGAGAFHGNARAASLLSELPVSSTEIADAVRVEVGERHECALTKQGKVHRWGFNEHGSLGPAFPDEGPLTDAPLEASYEQLPAIHQLATVSLATCAADSSGGVWVWGSVDSNDVVDPQRFEPAAVTRVLEVGGD